MRRVANNSEEGKTHLRKNNKNNIYYVAEGCTDTICCSFFMIKKENYLIKVQNNEHHGCRENGKRDTTTDVGNFHCLQTGLINNVL